MPLVPGLRFEDHPGFHRAFVATAIGAGGAGAVAALGPATIAGVSAPIFAAVVGAAAGLSWAERPFRAWRIGVRLVTVAAIGAAAGVLNAPALVATGLVAVLMIGTTPRTGMRWWFTTAAAVVAGVVATWAARRAGTASAMSTWNPATVDAIAGGFLGVIAGAAVSARHVVRAPDRVGAAWKALPALSGEPRALVDRGLMIWKESDAMAPENRALVEGGVTTLFAVAARAAATPIVDDAAIAVRIEDLDTRIAGCTDAIAADQYRDARQALIDQRRYATSVAASRERVLARMHHCVATLEKFGMACAHADASLAARDAADARSAVAVLADLSDGQRDSRGDHRISHLVDRYRPHKLRSA
jgi:hypothetical protein